MKKKLSITVEQDKIEKIELAVASGLFRNKSHVIESALNKFLEEYKHD